MVGTFILVTLKDPVWGDFHAKDGKANSTFNAVWNLGFIANAIDDPDDSDPGNLLFNVAGDEVTNPQADHIPVPDTEDGGPGGPGPTPVIPEPITVLGVLGGLGALGGYIRKRRGALTA